MEIKILHLGFGRVGQELIRQLAGFEQPLLRRLGISLKFEGVFRSNLQLTDPDGFSAGEILNKRAGEFIKGNNFDRQLSAIRIPFIVLDTTASEDTYPWLIKSLKRGGLVVLSNKKPLAGKLAKFKKIIRFGENRIYFETVVGAGLPIIKTIKEMQATGDKILEIRGAFSGTLGFILSEIQKGRKFSQAVLEARERGFTEPDPRDDLSGLDVARKTLILSRLLGIDLEMEEIKLISMVPPEMAGLTVGEFLNKLPVLDDYYADKVASAGKRGRVLRFLVKISRNSSEAGLQEVSGESDIGTLRGPDNIVVIKSRRYFKNPLVIKGPGAGIEVTAAGVFADMLEAIKTIRHKNLPENSFELLPANF